MNILPSKRDNKNGGELYLIIFSSICIITKTPIDIDTATKKMDIAIIIISSGE